MPQNNYPITVPAPYTSLSPTTTPPSVSFAKGTTVGSTKTFTVTATVSGNPVSSACTITYYNSRYAGANAQHTQLSSTQVVALGAVAIDNAMYGSFSVNAGAGQYIWYAHRAALGGVPYFAINGERAAFTQLAAENVTNASGFTESFQQYVSALKGLGNVTVTAAASPSPNRVYLIASTATSVSHLTDSEINSATTTGLQDSINFAPEYPPTTGPGQYLWYLFPARLTYTTIAFYVNSQVEGGMDGVHGGAGATLTHVNQWGYSETYRAFRSDNANLGTISSWSCAVT